MCGRGALTLSGDRCRRIAGGNGGGARVRGGSHLKARYNLTPRSFVPVVRQVSNAVDGALPGHTPQFGNGVDGAPAEGLASAVCDKARGTANREVSAMRWGLVPSFAKRAEDFDAFSGGTSTYNARVEGLESSNLWRRLLNAQRGVVLLDGFYEWKTVGKEKAPMFIRHRDGYDDRAIPMSPGTEEKPAQPVLPLKNGADDGPAHAPLMLAALYDVWKDPDAKSEAEWLESTTIITMEPDGTPMMAIHDRMPVFLTPESAARWLDASESFSAVIGDVIRDSRMHAASQLTIYEVSTLVSNVRNESPDCILPKKAHDEKKFSNGLGRFFKKSGGATPDSPSRVGPGKRSADAEAQLGEPPIKVICLDGSP